METVASQITDTDISVDNDLLQCSGINLQGNEVVCAGFCVSPSEDRWLYRYIGTGGEFVANTMHHTRRWDRNIDYI
jgi:hypothetical protein